MTDRRVKLGGGLQKTVTWIWLENNRQLKVEFYDFSELAQRMFGNDIAYTWNVHEMARLFSVSQQSEESLIPWIAENFKSHFDIQRWLEENGIGFRKEVDPWA